MKFLPVSLAFLGGLLPLLGQEKAPPQWDVEVPVPISNGTPPQPAPKPEPIDFSVQTSRTTRMQVTDTSEIAEIPPVKGKINVTVQLVDDPGLPAPPPPLPVLKSDDPAVIARMEELRKNYRRTELVFLSATVYDHSRTLLRIYPNGNVEGEISAWSNVDFNHFCGISTFRVKAPDGTIRDYGLLMGIGDVHTHKMRERLALHEQDYKEPEIPDLPDLAVSGPSFVVVGGQKEGKAMDTLSQVHDLYRK